MPSPAHRAHQYLRRAYRRLSTLSRQASAAFTLLARIVRPFIPGGSAPRKEFLVLRSAAYVPGLFSAFATVLGMLEHYDKWQGRYAGIRVDFGNEGLYYERSAGNNWWEYFFEPVACGAEQNGPRTIIGEDEHFYFAHRVERAMPRRDGAALINRYIRPQPHIRAKVDAYVRANFDGAFMIGIHYRGTDKFEDAPRVPYERVHSAVLDAINAAGAVRCKFFVATDEQAFLEYMLKMLPGMLHHLEMYRSVDGTPIDLIQGDNRKKGENAVLDCLLLSRCSYLIRTASNLSLCSTFFNPDMPVLLLNRER